MSNIKSIRDGDNRYRVVRDGATIAPNQVGPFDPETVYIVNGTRIDTTELRRLLASEPAEARGGIEFRKLPEELWRYCDPVTPGSCACRVCKPEIGPRAPAYWDTLACVLDGRDLRTWTVHYPELTA